MQLQVMNSPFNQEQAELLNRLLPTLTESQKIWLSGYLSAQSVSVLETSGAPAAVSAGVTAPAISKEVTILYGSQTGNAQGLAENAGKQLEERGFQVTVSSMSDFKPNQLKKINNLLIVVSTHGEGEPPDNALSFHEFLHGRRAPKLDDLRFSVLALGDSSYEFFCQTGKEFDQRLEELGGKRISPRVDCDLDYDEPAAEWLESVCEGLSEAEGGSAAPAPAAAPQTGESAYSRTNPFRAEVLENLNLNGRGSNKETRHVELSLEGSGLTYEPGDSLGVYPENDPVLVDLLLQEMNWDPEEIVTLNKQGDVRPLKEALISHYEITVLTKPLLEQAAHLTGSEELRELLAPGNEGKVKAYIEGRDLLDLIRDYGPFSVTAQEFVSILRKMPARLYSIASSLSANPDEVHLTIGAVRYDAHGRERKGVCSILCAERLQPGDTLPVYVQHNQNFKLPKDPETPIIMVGPGTGVAPFRSFMQEREETGAEGKAWMFFGDQHFVTDFLYQTEWQNWLKDGVLTKMDVAFSRDTEEKVYVQHRMLEQSAELFEWLQEGAAVYICGDEKHMAHDVHNTLLDIIEKEGNMTREKAEVYLADMQQQKRYQRDVY
ncbi:assimilatory sulfite reductase (NADPH) flavoprotein subunit [Bacillus halotolerans]|uniref:assimilatory sulfite reductase (NADPH) flavoprotein subunit n=1 Tax=Bacillus halotolerans TaxID=260554 RepID=UPI000751A68F|nr:assimilatory sulfite reductase (NADPH) flavoprotein subunit [Bacillus halotolerans]KUP29145.1 sulfite reductase [NADPH] flavoprotein alpha-component [Bacillus halotolerans]MBJ7571714.1 assimilatory sulfite reductase (NADPH) flavoprotein subunit [Bacillus halotolerans]MBL4977947.1 assimilatory sulfite reductase (NADPH) flavoprotein subunit [Bacillus halotolerans]MEC0277657.1 assimilatory sulfite reductase (NADPH) flavoprotein subunit [Bacillus halotolerans]PHI46872.1 sulfite reductase [NADPH